MLLYMIQLFTKINIYENTKNVWATLSSEGKNWYHQLATGPFSIKKGFLLTQKTSKLVGKFDYHKQVKENN